LEGIRQESEKIGGEDGRRGNGTESGKRSEKGGRTTVGREWESNELKVGRDWYTSNNLSVSKEYVL
jgi:hypothetical protein